MPVNLDITSITGSSPYDIYLCDTGLTSCIYISTITTGDLTYTFSVPNILLNNNNQTLKIVDNDGCVILKNFTF